MENTEKRYFAWLCQFCGINDVLNSAFQKLMTTLHDTDFTYRLDMDGNRFEDGVNLRYRFGNEMKIPDPVIAESLDNRACSVLEMLVALSIRMETIMDDPSIGDRTQEWFWSMLDNLDLGDMTDDVFDKKCVDDILEKFLCRRYTRCGKGGLFYLPHPRRDLRSTDIWMQAMWYLDTRFHEE